MPANRVRLAPLLGLNGARAADENILPQDYRGIPMRGGFNVEVIDGEWWVRRGDSAPTGGTGKATGGGRVQVGSIPWSMMQVGANESLMFNRWYALLFDANQSSGRFRAPYAVSVRESCNFTNGSAAATSATNRSRGQLMIVESSAAHIGDAVYRVIAATTTAMTLDRTFEEPTTSYSVSFLDSFTGDDPLQDTSYYGEDRTYPEWGAALFHQEVTQSSPVVLTAGGVYAVIASAGQDPVALRLDVAQTAHVSGFIRDTSLSSPTSITPERSAITVIANRLVVADRNRVLWSGLNDMSFWHSGSVTGGTASLNAVNFDNDGDAVKEVNVKGGRLVIHKETSQTVGTVTGSDPPFTFFDNESGLGLVSRASLVTANQRDYFMSQNGPAVFDGQSIQPMALEQRRQLESMGFWSNTKVIGVHAPELMRIYWYAPDKGLRHQDASSPPTNLVEELNNTGETYVSTGAVLVYDYGQQAWWFEDRVGFHGGGTHSDHTETYISRFTGEIIRIDTDYASGVAGSGKDFPIANYGVESALSVPVDALVDTPWIDFGALERKTIDKLIVGMRPLDITAGGSRRVNDLWELDSETLHLFTLDVYTDNDMRAVRATYDANIVVSDMLAYKPDENQQMPLMEEEVRGLGNVAGQSFKFRFKNALSDAASDAGHKKGAFRISYIEVYYHQEESTEPLAPSNAR